MGQSTPSSGASGFARVLRSLLRPLVKAMIAHGITLPALTRMLKEIFVEVAESEFALEDRPSTDSRISMLTGVHRKDVRTLRSADRSGTGEMGSRVSAFTSVIGRWLADPALTDSDGRPVALPRQARSGPSFEALAASVSNDIRPRTILDELLRQGVVREEIETGLLRLEAEAFVGPAEIGQQAHFFSENVGDHIAAATENLLAEPGAAPFIERAVFYNRLTPGSVAEIEGEARRLSAAALARLNRLAFARQQHDAQDPAAGERFRFGVFFYRATEDAGPDREGGDDARQD